MLIVRRMIGMQVGVGISFTGSIKVTEYNVVCAQVVCVSDESPMIRRWSCADTVTARYAREASYDENRTELYENGTELPVLRTCTLFIVMSRWMPDRQRAWLWRRHSTLQTLRWVLPVLATRMCLSIPCALLLLSAGFRMFSVCEKLVQ